MNWILQFDPAAKKELSKLDRAMQKAVTKYLLDACQLQDPASRGHALAGPWAGFHRYRIGQLRAIVQIERKTVTILVIKIDRRDSVY